MVSAIKQKLRKIRQTKINAKQIAIISLLVLFGCLLIYFVGQYLIAHAVEDTQGSLTDLLDAAEKAGTNATSDQISKNPLIQYEDHFVQHDLFTNILRQGSWAVIRLVYSLVNVLGSLLSKVNTLFGFTDKISHSLYGEIYKTVVAVLMAVTLGWIGIKVLIADSQISFNSVFKNIAISMALMIALPGIMADLNDVTNHFYALVDSSTTTNVEIDGENINMNAPEGKGVMTIATRMVADQTYDLYFPLTDDSLSFKDYFSDGKRLEHGRQGIQDNTSLSLVDPTEFYASDPDKLPTEIQKNKDNRAVLLYGIQNMPSRTERGKNKPVVKKMDADGFLVSMFKNDNFVKGYYRYTWNTFFIVTTLAALGAAYLFSLFSLSRCYLEMAFQLVFAIPILATDFESGQKTKSIMKSILNSFLTIMFTVVSFYMFELFMEWLYRARTEQGLNAFLMWIFILTAVILLISGSQTILRWYGIDVGVQDGFSMTKWLVTGTLIRGLSRSIKTMRDFLTGKGTSERSGQSSKQQQDPRDETQGDSPFDQQQEDDFQSKFSDFVSGPAQKAGYARQRGFAGLGKDAINRAKTSASDLKDDLSDKANAMTGGVLSGMDQMKDAYQQGKDRAKWSNGDFDASMDQQETNEADEQENNQSSANDQESMKKKQMKNVQTKNSSQSNNAAQGSMDQREEQETLSQIQQVKFGDEQDAMPKGGTLNAQFDKQLNDDNLDNAAPTDDELNALDQQRQAESESLSSPQSHAITEEQRFEASRYQTTSSPTSQGTPESAMNAAENTVESMTRQEMANPSSTAQGMQQMTASNAMENTVESVTRQEMANPSSVSQGMQQTPAASAMGSSATQEKVDPSASATISSNMQQMPLPSGTKVATNHMSTRLFRVEGDTLQDKADTLAQGVFQMASQPEAVQQGAQQVLSNPSYQVPEATQGQVAAHVGQLSQQYKGKTLLQGKALTAQVKSEIAPMLSSAGVSDNNVESIAQEVSTVMTGHTPTTERYAKGVQGATIAKPEQFRHNIERQMGGTLGTPEREYVKSVAQSVSQKGLRGRDAANHVSNQIKQAPKELFQKRMLEQVESVAGDAIEATNPQFESNIREVGRLEEEFYLEKDRK